MSLGESPVGGPSPFKVILVDDLGYNVEGRIIFLGKFPGKSTSFLQEKNPLKITYKICGGEMYTPIQKFSSDTVDFLRFFRCMFVF